MELWAQHDGMWKPSGSAIWKLSKPCPFGVFYGSFITQT